MEEDRQVEIEGLDCRMIPPKAAVASESNEEAIRTKVWIGRVTICREIREANI